MCFCNKNRGEVTRGSAWALVTGAALGIGREYAVRLAELGYNLYMVDILEDVKREAEIIAHAHSIASAASNTNDFNDTLAHIPAVGNNHIFHSYASLSLNILSSLNWLKNFLNENPSPFFFGSLAFSCAGC